MVWSEHFTAALLHTAPAGERVATARTLALNLGILGVLGGVHAGRPALAAAGALLTGAVVVGHAVGLATRVGRALPGRLGARSGSTWPPAPPCSPGWASACCWPAERPTVLRTRMAPGAGRASEGDQAPLRPDST